MRLILILVILLLNVAYIDSYSVKRNKELEKYNLEGTLTCGPCKLIVATMSYIVKFDTSEPVILAFAKLICNLYAKQSWAVCDGISQQFRDEFFYVFRNLSSSSPTQVCGILIPECAVDTDPSQSGWEVALPVKSKVQLRRRVKSRNLRVLQLSDLHIDLNYLEGSEASCGLPVCCNTNSPVTITPAGYWGTVGSCDIPMRTFENLLQHVSQTQKIDYIMMSGDYINHVDWTYDKAEHLKVLTMVDKAIKKYFPNTPAYWALGNHEGIPVNSFAPHTVDERFWPTWLYDKVASFGQPFLDAMAVNNTRYRGSFMTKIGNGLRLISLNTGFCETTNFFLYLNQSDPDGTMSWLVSELYQAELAGEAVHIMAHIPPGDGECLEGWARNYYRVIQRFSSTVSAQFFGHVHLDYFTVFYEDMHNISSKPINVAYAAPSVTTFADLNPAYRVYNIDSAAFFSVTDIDNYYSDLSLANSTNPPQWKLLYSTKKTYNMTDLSPTSWNSLIRTMEKDTDLQDKFTELAYRTEDPPCGLLCKRSLMCSLRMGHHNESLYCGSFESKSYLDDNRILP